MPYDYDVFLSHNSKDKPAVEALARLLQEKYKLKCWLDKWNLVPGEPWQEALEKGLDHSSTVAVFVGPNQISPWENEEMRSAIESRVHDTKRRVIPVLLPGASDSGDLNLPRFLSRLTWVDFRPGLHEEEALYRLYCGIKGIEPPPDGWKKKDEGSGLPYGSYVPFIQNKNFTGREEDLKHLAENLLKPEAANTVISQAVTGMGGLGKTQLAVEFAYRYGQHFKGVHWLDLRDPQAVDAAIALCGTKMGYTQVDQRELIASTMKAWTEDGPRLLILDNFEDAAQTNQVLVRFQHPSFRILLTSRRRDFPKSAGLQVQKLGVFSEDESVSFLEKTLEQGESAEARRKLAEQLGCLPLALELAAGYINITKIGIEGYLRELGDLSKLEAEQVEWFKSLEVSNPTEHELSLYGTFQLSWGEVKDETAQKVFMIAGYLAPNAPIPLEIFKETLELEEKELAKAIYRLNALGMLPVTNDLPTIHTLLAAYARTLSSKELLEKLAYKLSVLARQANEQVNQTGRLGWFVPLRPHVKAAADFAEASDVPNADNLFGHLGYYLNKTADYQGARSADELALKVTEKVYGPDHANMAVRYNNLGYDLQDLGDLAGAKNAYERALKIDETAYGPDHPNVARDVNNLGSVLRKQGDLAGAKAAYERALKINEATYGLDHPGVAIAVNNLGNVLQDLGDLTGAQAAFERALKIDEATYGPDHPTVAIRVNNLGRVMQDLGDLAGAQVAFERALQILKQFLPERHPYIRIAQENLDAVSKRE